MFMYNILIYFIYVICLCGASDDQPDFDGTVIITYEQGTLRGRMDNDRNGNSFYSFQGIPYAEPPINDLRFKDPIPFEKWNNSIIWDGTKEGYKCPQKLLDGSIVGDENCLFINVYTRAIAKDYAPPKHVFVWFHGGSFVEGSGNTDIHGPKYIVSEDFILVTFNYRLGALGFLTIDDEKLNITGNVALKDQLLALRWVRKYIHNFAGDSTKVTIAGNSAGGMCATLQMLSQYSETEKLFNNVISQSAPLLLYDIVKQKSWAKELAVLLQFDPQNNSTEQLYKYLKYASVRDLLNAQLILSGVQNTKNLIHPIVEPNYAKNRFLSEPPINTIKKGNFRKVPYLTGFVDQEAMFVLLYISLDPNIIPKNVSDFEKYLPLDMGLEPGSNESLAIAARVKARYFNNGDDVQNYFNLVADTSFVLPINRQVEELSKVMNENSLFYYLFTLDTELNLFKRQSNITEYKGAAHTDEKGYLFNYDGSPTLYPNSKLNKYIDRMLLLWTNFAKYGNPNGKGDGNIGIYWRSVTKTDLHYLKIDQTLTTNIKPFGDRIAFWEHLYSSLPTNKANNVSRTNPINLSLFMAPVLILSILYSY